MRVKRGFALRRRHKKLLKRASGFRARRKNCYKIAKRAVQKALQFSYRDRKAKKRDMRGLWIVRINAAARINGTTYRHLIAGMKKASIGIDRKMLAELATTDAVAFKAVVDRAVGAV